MFNLYNICLLRAFEHIYMEFARYKCLLGIIIVIITSAASTLGETWLLSSHARNINFLLYLAL